MNFLVIENIFCCGKYSAMVAATVLASTSFPAFERSLVFQPTSLLWTFSITKLKALPTQPWCMIGNPSYLPRLLVALIPSLLQTLLFLLLVTFREKNILDLPWFTFCPAKLQKLFRTSRMASQFLAFALTNNMGLSAKNTCEKLGPFDLVPPFIFTHLGDLGT